MGLENEANYCSNINFTPNNAFCSPCILQTFHIYSLSICGGHHHHHRHVGCHGTQRRPSEVEAMEAELESDKSGPVCIVNRYRHSKRQRMMEKQLDAESPTCSPAGDENEQNHQHTSFAAGSHDFQESPTHTSVGCSRRHEPKDQPTSLSTGGHRFLASPTRARRGQQREHRDQPTSFATGGHESHGGRLWRGTMPAVQPTRLGSANAAQSVLCPIGHLRLKLRQNDRREKVFKRHQMTNTKCLQKQGHDRRQACPECGKKICGTETALRQRLRCCPALRH